MSLFCENGQTAKVTLPDGQEELFNNCPISVQVQELPTLYKFELFYDNYIVNNNGEFYQNTSYGSKWVWLKIDELLEPSNINQSQLALYYRTTREGEYNQYIVGGSTNIRADYKAELSTSTLFNSNGLPYKYTSHIDFYTEGYLPNYSLKIFHENDLLFEKIYNSDLYTVECLSCPPGTLDCQGCCYDCTELNNGILSIIDTINNIGVH